MLKNVSNFYHKLMTLPDQLLIFLSLVDKVVVDIYMPDLKSLSNIFAKVFIVLYRYMKNLGQPSCFCYK